MLVGVLALQGDVREHERALAHCGAVTMRVRNSGQLRRIDGLVIPGGESTTITKLAIDLGLFEPLAARVREGMPIFGSCAGMIMLASRVEGGLPGQPGLAAIDMTVRRNAFGRQVESFESDVDMPAIGDEPIRGVFIRAPWVERVGPGVEVLATVPGPGALDRIVAVRQGVALATAFHPELTGDHRVHRLFVESIGANQRELMEEER
ncbi:MAG: pyridoxal 5'-phosphate synthase glutaminase subunit PdxT [Candidatus Nanopelagicales bacterium]|nr:pyridoxal 5'-phosphate synthase glutaminase subunit PdxT [Candidatus Nanopelagicales bacterium]